MTQWYFWNAWGENGGLSQSNTKTIVSGVYISIV